MILNQEQSVIFVKIINIHIKERKAMEICISYTIDFNTCFNGVLYFIEKNLYDNSMMT